MNRRAFIVGSIAALAAPLGAQAQQARKVPRIGLLRNGPPPKTFIEGLKQGLRDVGYVEGQNIAIEYGIAETVDQLERVATDLVRRKADVLLASGTPPTVAAKRATNIIPIVFVASIDPIATRMVASLAKPGGNITGFTGTHADLMGKRLELLRETLPHLTRIALLAHAANPGNAEYMRQAHDAARAIGIVVQHVVVRDVGDLERAFGEARGATALVQLDDVLFTSHRKKVVDLAAQHRLPMMYGFREFVEAGGLMAYGPDLPDLYRRAATYIHRIINGVSPAELPVEQPTKFELVINLKTAKALGLTIPPSLLLRADQVIE